MGTIELGSCSIEEAIVNAVAAAAREGTHFDSVLISCNNYATLVNSLGHKVMRYSGTDGIVLLCAYGHISVHPSSYMPNFDPNRLESYFTDNDVVYLLDSTKL